MELYLQFGYGMMEHCRVLLDSWGGGSVILSPRDLTDDQLVRFGSAIREIPGGDIMLDPQFYLPHSDHEKLCNHAYWPTDYATTLFWQDRHCRASSTACETSMAVLVARASYFPVCSRTTIDDDWGETQRAVLERHAPEATCISHFHDRDQCGRGKRCESDCRFDRARRDMERSDILCRLRNTPMGSIWWTILIGLPMCWTSLRA